MSNRIEQQLYEHSEEVVRASFGNDRERAIAFYHDLIEFVRNVVPPSASAELPRVNLLDVGCGCGWSTAGFAEEGYDATGIDLNPNAFEPPATQGLTLRGGSAFDIAFPDNSFDIVVSYQCVEHLPSPARAFQEMARVCKPGGVVCIVGPNLITPLMSLAFIARPSHWSSVPFRRTAALPRHPNGNTWGEIVGLIFVRSWQMFRKLFRRHPQFLMRDPDVVPPFHSDNDSCYLCCPQDLIAHFQTQGFTILRKGKQGRPSWSYPFARGTWVAARKPG
jgi:SAM-dependent methyltransferase